MSAVTSCSALPIGLRCLPAGPASRPPNFPCTPLWSHRPGRGVPTGLPNPAGAAERHGKACSVARREERGAAPCSGGSCFSPGWMEDLDLVASLMGSAEPWGPATRKQTCNGVRPPLGKRDGSVSSRRLEERLLSARRAVGLAPFLAAAGVGRSSCGETPVLRRRHPDELNVRPAICPKHLVRSLDAR